MSVPKQTRGARGHRNPLELVELGSEDSVDSAARREDGPVGYGPMQPSTAWLFRSLSSISGDSILQSFYPLHFHVKGGTGDLFLSADGIFRQIKVNRIIYTR